MKRLPSESEWARRHIEDAPVEETIEANAVRTWDDLCCAEQADLAVYSLATLAWVVGGVILVTLPLPLPLLGIWCVVRAFQRTRALRTFVKI